MPSPLLTQFEGPNILIPLFATRLSPFPHDLVNALIMLTVAYARGASRIARAKVIVKRPASIECFGSMNK